MKISIAMATYNGANFLQAQLESFSSQTRLPDELVVCDDKSTDETIEILNNFSKTAPFKMYIHRNNENIGYARNFEKIIGLCSGELIFLSDQDDVWFAEKIQCIEDVFETSSGLLVVIGDVQITDANLVPTGRTLLDNMKKIGKFSSKYHVLGCATAFHAKMKPLIVPLPKNKRETSGVLAHDIWIHALGESCRAKFILNKPLQFYRRHDDAVTSFNIDNPVHQLREFLASSSDPRPTFQQSEKILAEVEERLRKIDTNGFDKSCLQAPVYELIDQISNERKAILNRIRLNGLSRSRKFFFGINMWIKGDYKYFLGWKSFCKDMVR